LLERKMAIEDVVHNVDGSVAAYRMTDGRMREKLPGSAPSGRVPQTQPEGSSGRPFVREVSVRSCRKMLRLASIALLMLCLAVLGMVVEAVWVYGHLPREMNGFMPVFSIIAAGWIALVSGWVALELHVLKRLVIPVGDGD